MYHRIITFWAKRKVTDDGCNTKLIGAQHQAYSNSNKPAEGSFSGKQDSKWHKTLSNKIQHDRMVNSYMR